MEMVGNQSPGIAVGRCLDQDGAQPGDEIIPVRIIGKYGAALNATADDVVQGAGRVYAGLSGHV